ncbi:hypothetical protein HDV05_006123 [Chytridiales sp. JEL 0842]|nr:hypothetical protein HDV05_006123 [Chytridiales sp. JEL 0842]
MFMKLLTGNKKKASSSTITTSTKNTSLHITNNPDDSALNPRTSSSSISTNPISHLPPSILLHISFYLDLPTLFQTLLVNRYWSFQAARVLYASPPLRRHPEGLERLVEVLTIEGGGVWEYEKMVGEVDIGGPTAESMELGDLETLLGLCPGIHSLRLRSCMHISSLLLRFLADYTPNLSRLDLSGCPISDGHYLDELVEGCRYLKRIDLSWTNVGTHRAVEVLVGKLGFLEDLNLNGTRDDSSEYLQQTSSSFERVVTPTAPYLTRVSLHQTTITPQLLQRLVYSAPLISHLNLMEFSSPKLAPVTDSAVVFLKRSLPELQELRFSRRIESREGSPQPGRRAGGGLVSGIAMASAKELTETLISSNAVAVFSKTYCPYCTKAKRLLDSLGIAYKAYELDNADNGSEVQGYLASKTGQRTVPNIFIHGQHVGGCDDLHEKHRKGELKKMVAGN